MEKLVFQHTFQNRRYPTTEDYRFFNEAVMSQCGDSIVSFYIASNKSPRRLEYQVIDYSEQKKLVSLKSSETTSLNIKLKEIPSKRDKAALSVIDYCCANHCMLDISFQHGNPCFFIVSLYTSSMEVEKAVASYRALLEI